jgi:hypothetical protein
MITTYMKCGPTSIKASTWVYAFTCEEFLDASNISKGGIAEDVKYASYRSHFNAHPWVAKDTSDENKGYYSLK